MWQMKDWFFKFFLQALWRRRKGLYYVVSVVSIAGNLIVFIGPSLQAPTVLRNVGALQAACSALPQVVELILHRSVLYILLNLIVARIVVKSGILGRTAGMPVNIKQDEFCSPISSYYGVRGGVPWPPGSTYTAFGMQSAPVMHMFTNPSIMPLQRLVHGDANQTSTTVTKLAVCAHTPAPQQTSFKKLCEDKKPKCAGLAPSLFTIEPLSELVPTANRSTSVHDDQAHIQKTLQHPLRKVASRAMDLHRSIDMKRCKDSVKAEVQLQQQKKEQSMQLVLARQAYVDGSDQEPNVAAEHDDYSLSRQEFNERVDSFIVKFKRNLTMQRQDSFNRLLGLVGGGGDIRLLK